jgi:Flp pilus assembly protein CpaB
MTTFEPTPSRLPYFLTVIILIVGTALYVAFGRGSAPAQPKATPASQQTPRTSIVVPMDRRA